MRFFLFLLLTVPAWACTDFVVQATDKSSVVGRSMEFGLNLESQVLIQPKNTLMQSRVFNGLAGMKWRVQYAYIGMTALGQDWLVDGMNEAGLSIGALWFPGSDYPKVDESIPQKTIALEDLGDWILSSFETIDEVKKAIHDVQVWPHDLPKLNSIPPLHLSLHDAQGNSAAIEFLDGKLMFFDNPVGVLTNAPKLEWHLTNLPNYINLSAMQKEKASFDGLVLHPPGQGFGMLGVPGDWTPPSRFVRIATFKNFANTPKNAQENVTLALHLLNTVDIPYGAVRNVDKEHYDYTQWIVVKDLSNGDLYYRTYRDLDVYRINLQEELRKGRNTQRKLPVYGAGS
ncbi:MAG: choloylglycine hydrolase family protein [Chlamydiales bacterium]|nr:choloylglycine hydrolase family protein [Chlamydiales bacterium]